MPEAADSMIRLDKLTKHYPGEPRAAVDGLSLDVRAGEIVVLVGPSGCGKTTTMKMINRIIEPTSGRIYLEGEDVTTVKADQLRRRIGYVIQQVGLFPHMTIANNIAVVPKMLGWDRGRITERVDQLLALVGLDPATFRDRYPKQLSGGQQQRVGVARALGADPPVMLMDEPFAAIDPITREKLQDEFLSVQHDIHKTIIFVTHDIDEAIKMGDRIAILRENSQIAQYDTPAHLLSNPADEFVQDFLGSGSTVKRLMLIRAQDIEMGGWPTVDADAGKQAVLAEARRADEDFVLMLDRERRPVGWLPVDASASDADLLENGLPVLATIRPADSLYEALDLLLRNDTNVAIAVDEQGAFRGVLDLDRLRQLIHADTDREKFSGSRQPVGRGNQ